MAYSFTRFSFLLVVAAVLSGAAFVGIAAAQNPFDIEFPIAELGNCGSVGECKAFCDDVTNADACVSWAKGHGIETREAPPPPVPPEGGPGGCSSEEECRAYCDSDEHIDECLDFGVKQGFVSPDEVSKIKSQRERGGPGGCRGPEECNEFCRNPANQNTCIDFAVQNGFMSAEEAERARAFVSGNIPGIPRPGEFAPQAVRGPVGPGEPGIDKEKAAQVLGELGGGPGGCKDFNECQAFCDDPTNSETCFNFAVEHELMSSADAEKFKRAMNAEGPGGCRGRECEAYCNAPGHERECLEFAREQGFIGDEEFEEAQKFVRAAEAGGPGGCRGRECESYCNDPAHRNECFEFAKSNNLLPPQEIERIEKFKAIDEKVKTQGGPGGCRGESECRLYCSDASHFDECAAFAVNEGFLKPEEAQQSLRQFIQIEQFGPQGPQQFGPQGPRQFGPPQGFSQQGFGPGSEGGFPPGFENIPPEFRSQVEEQFKSRFEQFEQMRAQFERGEIPRPMMPRQGFPGGPGEGDQMVLPQGGEGAPGEGGQFMPPQGRQFPMPPFIREGGEGEVFRGPGMAPDSEGVEQFKEQFRERFNTESGEQFKQQFNEQFKQFEGFFRAPNGGTVPGTDSNLYPSPQTIPPSGTFAPFGAPREGSDGSFAPMQQFQPPIEQGTFIQPPPGSFEGGSYPSTGSFDGSGGTYSAPPPGSTYPMPSPEGTYSMPPSGGTFTEPSGTFMPPPPDSSFSAPPPTGSGSEPPPPPPPTSSVDAKNFFANTASSLLDLLVER